MKRNAAAGIVCLLAAGLCLRELSEYDSRPPAVYTGLTWMFVVAALVFVYRAINPPKE
jgi:hypothetical protein